MWLSLVLTRVLYLYVMFMRGLVWFYRWLRSLSRLSCMSEGTNQASIWTIVHLYGHKNWWNVCLVTVHDVTNLTPILWENLGILWFYCSGSSFVVFKHNFWHVFCIISRHSLTHINDNASVLFEHCEFLTRTLVTSVFPAAIFLQTVLFPPCVCSIFV